MTEQELTVLAKQALDCRRRWRPYHEFQLAKGYLVLLAERDAEREEKLAFMSVFLQVKAERDALKGQLDMVTRGMDRESGNQFGSSECPWCYEEGLQEPFAHAADCKLVAARKLL